MNIETQARNGALDAIRQIEQENGLSPTVYPTINIKVEKHPINLEGDFPTNVLIATVVLAFLAMLVFGIPMALRSPMNANTARVQIAKTTACRTITDGNLRAECIDGTAKPVSNTYDVRIAAINACNSLEGGDEINCMRAIGADHP